MKKFILSLVFIIFCAPLFAEKELPVRCTGDNVTYVKEENTIYGKGNVEISYQNNYLRADNIKVNTKTKIAEAEGRIVFSDGKNILTGNKASFNFDTGKGTVDGAGTAWGPWFAKGPYGERISKDVYYVKRGSVTTCDYEKPHYRLQASDIYIYPGDKIIAKNIVGYWGNVPVFYWPYFKKSLKDERSPWTIIPGYNSQYGKFLLTGYTMWFDNFLGGTFTPTLRFDYYEKRGPAVGLYGKYKYKDKITSLIRSYLIDDKAYDKDGKKVHETRGRFSMDYVQKIADDVRGLLELNLLSDADIMKDFFRDEFNDDIQKENYINIAKTTPWYQLSLMVKKRLNSFYTEMDKLPELTFSLLQRRIGKTNLLYNANASLGYLYQRFARSLNQSDYDAARFDMTHALSYPMKYFGWLNIIPRAGLRETYWSKRAQSETVDINGVPTTVKTELNKGTWRTVLFTGAEFTTKISKVMYVQSNFWDINQLRHVIEPRINYAYQPDPTMKAEDLLDFGDLAYKDNHFDLGLRNKLQTKRGTNAWDLVDLNITSTYYPDKETNAIYSGEDRSFTNIYSKLELRPFDWIAMDMDSSFDQYDLQVDTYNTELVYYKDDKFSFGLGYRYSHDVDKLWTSEINYTINSNWALRMQHRFEFDTGELQQQEYILVRDMHCWNVAFSFRQYRNIDETAGFIVVYPKAYPQIPVTFGSTFFGVDDTNKLDFDVM